LLGRRVLEDEAISVRAFEPPALSDERRQEIAGELKRYSLKWMPAANPPLPTKPVKSSPRP